MILNVIDIQKEIGSRQSFSGEMCFDDINWQGELIGFKGPLHIDGEILNGGDVLLLNCKVHGTLNLMCGSCTQNFDHSLDFTFEAKFTKEFVEDDPDLFMYSGYEIDISDIVLQFVLLSLPSKRRCEDNCKGLCPICGVNLNEYTCDCSENEENDPDDEIDERFAILKDLLPDSDEEV